MVHLPILKASSLGEVSWLADLDKNTLSRVSDAYGVTAQVIDAARIELPEVDIALLATPLYARQQYLEYFSLNGTAVLCEKPFAVNIDDHRHYLALSGGSSFYCGYMRRAYKAVRVLRAMVKANWFGSLRRIELHEGSRSTRGSSSRTLDLSYRQGGGVLRDLGCHGLDAILFVSNAYRYDIEQVKIEWDGETDRHVEANFNLAIQDEGVDTACAVDFTVSWLMPQSQTLVAHFETASIRVGIKPEQGLEINQAGCVRYWIPLDLDMEGATTSYQAFYLEWKEVIDAYQYKSNCAFDASESLLTTELVDALYSAGGAAR